MQRRRNLCSDRSKSSLARTSANTLQTSESFVRTAAKKCMRKDARCRETCLLHSARASRHCREDLERLLQRRQDARPTPEKMAWIHAFVLETPVSSPQGYVEDTLSSASHGGVSDSRTARPSTKDQVWHSNLKRVSLLVLTAKNPPCTGQPILYHGSTRENDRDRKNDGTKHRLTRVKRHVDAC